jgi:hypothetical protein
LKKLAFTFLILVLKKFTMNNKSRSYFLAALAMAILMTISCGKTTTTTDPAIPNITIYSLMPVHGPYNTIDTLNGQGFDKLPAIDSIVLNGKKMTLISRTDAQIIVDVPRMAGTGPINIWSGGKMFQSPVFTYDSILLVTTIAGTSQPGEVNGKGRNALFYYPAGIAVDHSGNIFVVDNGGSCIRKIDADTNVTTFAGPENLEMAFADGTGSAARFSAPVGLCIDQQGFLYVADQFNYRIRKVSPAGVVTTFAGGGWNGLPQSGGYDGAASSATFNYPVSVACDHAGNIYVADISNNKIRKITPQGMVSTFAGGDYYHYGTVDGVGTAALFYVPNEIASDSSGTLYTVDDDNHLLRKITPDGKVTTLLGPLAEPMLTDFSGTFSAGPLATDNHGNLFFAISDGIIKMSPDGTITPYATGGIGELDGPAKLATYRSITGIATDDAGSIYITDNNRIRKIAWQ